MKGLIPSRRRGRPKLKEEAIKPTPQTVAKLKRDELTALLTEGELNPDQERAARNLHAFSMALRRGAVPTSNLTPGNLARVREAPRALVEKLSERQASHWSDVYRPWASAMDKRIIARRPRLTCLGLVERVVNENKSPEALACRFEVPQDQLLDCLREALDSYIAQKR